MTITAKELYDATIAGNSLLARHARDNPDMPVFLLIAQDQNAAPLVEKWAIAAGAALQSVGDKHLHDKVHEAREIADHMYRWPVHRSPD